jgi:diacylglycerol O-acyltransferase
MSATTLLAPEDVARLRMAVPENPMVITAALVLERSLTREALATLIETRLLRHERFRRGVVEPRWGSPYWADGAAPDVRDHCVWHAVQGRTPSLAEFVQECMSKPLDGSRPLWRVDALEGVDGGAVLVLSVHHVIADGTALVAILGGLSDEGSGADARPSEPDGRHAPWRLVRFLGGLTGAARLALRSPDPRMSLHGTLGMIKRVACSSPLSLVHLAASAHLAGVTITEMLLAAVASALRARLSAAGRHVRDLVVHALVPVSLRDTSHAATGNEYASVVVALPLADLPPDERLRRISDSFRVARARGALRASAHLVGAASAAGRSVERRLVFFFSRRATVVVSSVRGPSKPLHLGGVLVRDVVVWAPAPGSVPLSVSLMSYAGRVRIGVAADARVIGEPGSIVAFLERELGGGAGRA